MSSDMTVRAQVRTWLTVVLLPLSAAASPYRRTAGMLPVAVGMAAGGHGSSPLVLNCLFIATAPGTLRRMQSAKTQKSTAPRAEN